MDPVIKLIPEFVNNKTINTVFTKVTKKCGIIIMSTDETCLELSFLVILVVLDLALLFVLVAFIVISFMTIKVFYNIIYSRCNWNNSLEM